MEKEFFEFLKSDKISQVFDYAESSKMMVIKVKSNDVLDILYSLDVSDKNLFDFRKSFEYCGIYNKENNLLFNPTYSLYNNILGWKSDDKRIVNSNSLYESIKQDMDNRMKELIDYDVKELFDYDKYKLLDKIVDDDVMDYFMKGISSENLEKNYIEYNERKPSDIIDYLSNKEEFIETEAREYIFDHKDTILRNMKILEEKRKTLKKIEEDKNHPYYKIREIVNVLNENDCDAVNLTICKNGVEQTFKYDISELIFYPYPYLSIYGIKSLQERNQFQNNFGVWENFHYEDIVKMTYRGKTIYEDSNYGVEHTL